MYTTSLTLLERVRERTDADAWSRFVKLYTPFLFHSCRRMGLNEADAADTLQDVFLLLLEKLPGFHYSRDGSFRGWLRTVTINKCRERYRRHREAAAGGSSDNLAEVADLRDSDDLWTVEYHQQLVARALEIIQSEFEPTTWRAYWQTTVENRPAAEVAAELGVTRNAVFVARCRVLRRLRSEFSDLVND